MRRVLNGLTVRQAMDGPVDNFSLLRLVLAAAVVVSHGYSIPTGNNTLEPLFHSTGLRLGEHAVNGFFAISGFLVTMSFLNRGPRGYAVARLLRIVPGFVIAALVTVFVIGLMFTTLSPRAYLSHPETWRYLMQVLTGFKSAGAMPGVFTDNPHPWPMGTVWTLRYELSLYVAVLVAGMAGLLRGWRVAAAFAAILFSTVIVLDAVWPDAGKYLTTLVRLCLMFGLGATLYLAREFVRLSWPVLAILVFATWASFGTPLYFALLYVTEAYGVLVLALVAPLPFVSWSDRADLSYGIYLYGWPIQQVLVALYPQAAPVTLLAPALGLSAVAGFLSWTLIEKPALRFKVALSGQRLRFGAGQGT